MFRVLRTSDLIKIPIHVTFVAGGYMLRVGPYRLDLIPEEVNGTDALRLYVDRNPTPKIFLIPPLRFAGNCNVAVMCLGIDRTDIMSSVTVVRGSSSCTFTQNHTTLVLASISVLDSRTTFCQKASDGGIAVTTPPKRSSARSRLGSQNRKIWAHTNFLISYLFFTVHGINRLCQMEMGVDVNGQADAYIDVS
jgi:hypothetical protein